MNYLLLRGFTLSLRMEDCVSMSEIEMKRASLHPSAVTRPGGYGNFGHSFTLLN